MREGIWEDYRGIHGDSDINERLMGITHKLDIAQHETLRLALELIESEEVKAPGNEELHEQLKVKMKGIKEKLVKSTALLRKFVEDWQKPDHE